MADNNGTQLKVARPAILVAGQADAALAQRLMSLLIAETVHGLYRCEAVFSNWGDASNTGSADFVYFDRKLLDFGKAFSVKVGPDVLFEGRIMALEGQFFEGRAPQLAVLAEDRFQDLRMVRRTRSFTKIDDTALFKQIAGEHGLSPNVSVAGTQHTLLAQANQSDLAFLRDRARAIDAEVWVAGTTLNAQSRANRTGGPLKLTYQQGLREFMVLADLAGQRTALRVNGWDVAGKTPLTHEATDAILGAELNGFVSGASVLSKALGDRKESLAHTVPLSADEAKLEAEAVFKSTARRFVVGRGIAETEAKLRVGNSVDLQRLGPLFSGKYYLTEVRHLFDAARGLRTEFTAERAGLGQ